MLIPRSLKHLKITDMDRLLLTPLIKHWGVTSQAFQTAELSSEDIGKMYILEVEGRARPMLLDRLFSRYSRKIVEERRENESS